MSRCLVFFLAAACAPEASEPVHTSKVTPRLGTATFTEGATGPSPLSGPVRFEPPAAAVATPDRLLSGYVTTWNGLPLDDASVCTVDGCVMADDAYGMVDLPENEVDVWVSGEFTLVRHLQVVGGGDVPIVVPTPVEADAIAAWFDVERKPGLGIVFQPVQGTEPLTPELSIDADGPYFLDGRRWPMADADSVVWGGYVYFNVPPGLHTVHLPGCDEGDAFWGAPSDGVIDLEMAPDAWLGLSELRCND